MCRAHGCDIVSTYNSQDRWTRWDQVRTRFGNNDGVCQFTLPLKIASNVSTFLSGGGLRAVCPCHGASVGGFHAVLVVVRIIDVLPGSGLLRSSDFTAPRRDRPAARGAG